MKTWELFSKWGQPIFEPFHKLWKYLLFEQLFKHKLFYIIAIDAVFVIYCISSISQISIVKSFISITNDIGILKLSYFNSIFELCVTFCLGYSVIVKFRRAIKSRAYGATISLLNSVKKDTNVIFLVGNQTSTDLLTNCIIDLEERLAREKTPSKDKNGHRGEDAFMYFGYYSVICIICSGFLEGFANPHYEVYLFLLVFTIASIIVVETNYWLSSRSGFTLNLFLFLITLIGCFIISRLIPIDHVRPYFHAFFNNSALFKDDNDQYRVAVNYVTLFIVLINTYPYFIFFRKLYAVSAQYACTSYEIILYDDIYNKLQAIYQIKLQGREVILSKDIRPGFIDRLKIYFWIWWKR